jgi:uncharacterized membrane protein YhaH (DUF805 family)
MNEYLNMWKNYANFSSRTSVKGFWLAFLFHVIAAIILSIIGNIISSAVAVTADSVETVVGGVMLAMLPSFIYGLATLVPFLAITIRRLRDAGKPWYYFFFSFIPCVGFIILIVFLVGASIPDDGTPVV